MKFTSASDKNGILQDIDMLCRTTSASYAILDKTRNVNQAYKIITRKLWGVDSGWTYDDSNNTDLPIASKNLSASTYRYTLPTDAQKIRGIKISDVDLIYKDPDDIDTTVSGTPIYYSLIGRDILVEPTPTAVTVSTMVVSLDRDITEFTSGSTTEPGFDPAYHRILSYSAAMDYEEDINRKVQFLRAKEILERELIGSYSKRNDDYRSKISPNKNRNRYK